MDIPEAFLSLGTLYYAFKSGEFSPTGNNPYEDIYNNDDDDDEPSTPEVTPHIDHLPETSEEITYPDSGETQEVIPEDETAADEDTTVDTDAADADAIPVDF